MKLLLIAFVVLLALLAVAAFALGWAFSSAFLVPAPYGLMPEFEILDAEPGRVALPAPPPDAPQFARTRAGGDGVGEYGLRYEGGYGRLGPILADEGGRVVRAFEHVGGALPAAGMPARLDVTLHHRGPREDLGLDAEEVRIEGPEGELVAWWIDRTGEGSRDAVLMLHGRRRADRTEALRILPTVAGSGASVLVLAYRNHDASAPSGDGLFHYGHGEAEDALAAVRWLAERGVERVALYGFSMGGAVALEALERWPAGAPDPVALVLDSPLLDPRTVIRAAARERGLPAPRLLADLALAVGRLRTGVPWAELDQRRRAGELRTPLLLFAGTADSTVPIALVDEFAREVRGERVYRRLEGVEHVEGWNAAPDAYEREVRAFLRRAFRGAA